MATQNSLHFVGTAAYMAPEGTDPFAPWLYSDLRYSEMGREVAAESSVVVPDRSKGDIYSFGIILWEIIHRQRPWTRFTFLQVNTLSNSTHLSLLLYSSRS